MVGPLFFKIFISTSASAMKNESASKYILNSLCYVKKKKRLDSVIKAFTEVGRSKTVFSFILQSKLAIFIFFSHYQKDTWGHTM